MITVLEYLVIAAAIGLVVFVLAVFVFGRGEQMAALSPRTSPAELPDGVIAGDDVRRIRFSLALRGYRMSDVDWTLDRLSEELDRLHRRVAELGGEPLPEGVSPTPAAGDLFLPESDESERHLVAVGARSAAFAGDDTAVIPRVSEETVPGTSATPGWGDSALAPDPPVQAASPGAWARPASPEPSGPDDAPESGDSAGPGGSLGPGDSSWRQAQDVGTGPGSLSSSVAPHDSGPAPEQPDRAEQPDRPAASGWAASDKDARPE